MSSAALENFAAPTADFIDEVARELIRRDQIDRDGLLVMVGRKIAALVANQDPPLDHELQFQIVDDIVVGIELRIACPFAHVWTRPGRRND